MTPTTTMRHRVPELQPGDRLVRDEFERRYCATDGVKKAELLEGVVYMPSPARHEHGAPHTALAGGTSRIDVDGYVQGPPELAIEVALSSVRYDLHQKKHVYRRAGVAECLVLRVQDAAIDWFALRGGQYDRLEPDADGILRSVAFPGLWLDGAALLRCDDARLHEVAARGLGSPEHARFVAVLSG